MRTSDCRTLRWVPADERLHAAPGRAAPNAPCTDQAATGPSGRSRAKAALLAAPLAGGLALAGCAPSGIDRAQDACEESRTTMAAFATCLRRSYAALPSGSPHDRALFREYLAAADHQVTRVRAGEATHEDAMQSLAGKATELASKARQEQAEVFKQAIEILQPLGQQAQDQRGQTRDSQVDQPVRSVPYAFGPPPGGPFAFRPPPPLGGPLGFVPPPPPGGPFGLGRPTFQPAWR